VSAESEVFSPALENAWLSLKYNIGVPHSVLANSRKNNKNNVIIIIIIRLPQVVGNLGAMKKRERKSNDNIDKSMYLRFMYTYISIVNMPFDLEYLKMRNT
jgi:hypothetical protein